MEQNFYIMAADTKGLPYEYGSIMHYGLHAFSKNFRKTMSVLSKTAKTVGQRKGPSELDWQWLDKVYCTVG